jgi:plastocyanin
MLRSIQRLTVAAAMIVSLACPAVAGEVHIFVSSNLFVDPVSPFNVTPLNQGDHVVWVWTGSSHDVTSGNGATSTPDGLFASGPAIGPASNVGTAYTWLSSVTGNRTYYCSIHAPGMVGTLQIAASGVAVCDFRITEVEYGNAGNLDRIEIANLGDASGNLGRYRLSVSNGGQAIIPVNALDVAPGARVTIHTNETGTNTATDVFMGGTTPTGVVFGAAGNLGTTGSVALYAPYRQSGTSGPLNTDLIIDYVEWGAGGQPNEAIAAGATAGLWNAGQFVTGESLPGYSISFCGTKADHGPSFWSVTTPNFGTSGICTTPTSNTSWGRIKVLYR